MNFIGNEVTGTTAQQTGGGKEGAHGSAGYGIGSLIAPGYHIGVTAVGIACPGNSILTVAGPDIRTTHKIGAA